MQTYEKFEEESEILDNMPDKIGSECAGTSQYTSYIITDGRYDVIKLCRTCCFTRL